MSLGSLGTVLRDARVARGMSLRDVERASGIANAHLSQLETGRIRKPDMGVLWELAGVYEIDFEQLVQAAGHAVGGGSLTMAMRALDDLTDDERRQAVAFMAELKRRRGENA
ncbi:MAG TPA: helix-turn-helix transcriptional regulator [Solirubrobacteraceae bacterium]|nr:helix-turn-helix transcriptional regulator [Solirubrobacteraceae bacterium]